MMQYDFEGDERFRNMDPKKKAMMQLLLQEASTKGKDDFIPFLMKANAMAKEKGIQFSDSETELLLQGLKKDMSPAEQKRLELLRKVAEKLSKGK